MAKDIDLLKAKHSYLKALYDEENERQKTIEGKCFLIISNSGIFISLVGLLITILFGQKENIPFVYKVILTVIVLMVLFLYLRSTHFALKMLNPVISKYSRGNPDTVSSHNLENDFYKEIIVDFISSIDANLAINNTKADYLFKARRSFVFAIYFTILLCLVLLTYATFFVKTKQPDAQRVKIENIDQPLNKLRTSLDSINETLKKSTNKNRRRIGKIKHYSVNQYYYSYFN